MSREYRQTSGQRTFPKSFNGDAPRQTSAERTIPKRSFGDAPRKTSAECTIPKRSFGDAPRKTSAECTIPKRCFGETPKQPSSSVSESIQSGTSTSSLLSSDTSVFSNRSGSTSQYHPTPTHLARSQSQSLDLSDDSNRQLIRPQPQVLLPISTATRRQQNRNRTCSSNSSHRRGSQYTPFLSRRSLIVIAITSLSISVVSCGVTAFCFVFDFVPQYEDHIFKKGDYDACIPCSQLREGLNNTVRGQFFTTTTADGVEMCCSRNSAQFSALFQNIMNTRRNLTRVRPPEKRRYRASPASAHKHLRPSGIPDNEAGEIRCKQPFCHLKLNAEMNFNHEHVRGMLLRNNTFEINVAGWYYIYSSINFVLQPRRSNNQPYSKQTFLIEIKRMNPTNHNRSGILMTSTHTCSNDTCKEDHHTKYTGGMFELEAKEQIFVMVSDNRPVSFFGNKTYFGLVLMSTKNAWSLTTTPFAGSTL